MIFYKRSGFYIFDDTAAGGHTHYLNVNSIDIKALTTTRLVLSLDLIGEANWIRTLNVDEILDQNSEVYGTTVQDIIDAMGLSSDVTLQDQDTPVTIAKFNQVHNSTTTTGPGAIDDYIINVADATGIVAGSYIILFNPASVRYMVAYAVAVNSLAISLDTPLDFAYPSGTFVDVAITNMAVDGSSTVQKFGLRGTGAPPGIELTVDITRILYLCECTSAINLGTFANFAKLTRGVVLRKRDGTYNNVLNFKTNGELEGLCFDFKDHTSLNPAQGVDGFSARLTFASQGKMGVVQRLRLGEDLEHLIQDDLLTAQSAETITLLECVGQGSVVKP